MTTKKVLAIGFEALEPSLIEKWSQEGKLPAFAALMKEGAYRRMRSPAEISSGATWSSVHCGVTPGKHGMGFCHRQCKVGTYDVRKKRANEVGRLPFWVSLKKNQKRVFTFDVPETRLYQMPGVEITGWGMEYKAWKQESLPRDCMKNIIREFGPHPLAGWYQKKPARKEDWKTLSEKITGAVKTRTQIIKKILQEQGPFDFSFAVYAETHFSGHLFWHLHDPNHPEYDPELARFLGDPVFDCYRACDEALGELHEMNPEAAIMVIANTGMGPNYSGRHFVGEVLRRLHYRPQQKSAKPASGVFGLLRPSGDVFAVEKFEKLLGPQLIESVKKLIPEKIWDVTTRKILNFKSDWKDSKAYDIPGDNTGTLRLNLKGREPQGKVDPRDYHAVCDDLEKAFLALVDPATNERLVTEVVKVREKYPGDQGEELPDLVIKWREGKPITAMTSPRTGLMVLDHLPDKRTGAHKDFGFFLAAGPGIKHADHLLPIYNWDVAPTILAYLEQGLASDFDGHAARDMLESAKIS